MQLQLVLLGALLAAAIAFVPASRGIGPSLKCRHRGAPTLVMMGRRAGAELPWKVLVAAKIVELKFFRIISTAKIAARKGKQDALKAKAYARIGKMIIVAVKQGGDDPETNRALQQVLLEAKGVGVPKENIERAIKRAMSADVADYKESMFEAYGKGGAALLINVLSDNPNRAATQVKTAIKKGSISAASPGSVAFNFDRKGRLQVAGHLDEEEVLDVAIGADVDDFEMTLSQSEDGADITVITTDPEFMSALGAAVGEMDGVEGVTPSLVNIPKTYVDCSDEDFEANMSAIELLEELDDVDSVDHNISMDDTDRDDE